MGCICGKSASIAECCGPLIAGEQRAQTAEQLMRSRYTAHVMQAIDYLAATQDPKTRGQLQPRGRGEAGPARRWQGLRVVSVEGGGPEDSAGIVEFIASYSIDGELSAHHERSRFRRLDDGRWVYVDGDSPRASKGGRVGRNQPCPCGSGRKHKRCCGSG